jgi:hypothetical protein
VNWPACSSVASAATTLWPALCNVFAYAAPGLPRLQMRSGREVMGALSVEAATAESGVSTREGGVCRCFARRGFFFFGVEGVDEVVAIEFGESALTEEVALSVATACDSVGSDFHSAEIVSRSALSQYVIFDIFGGSLLVWRLFVQALLFSLLRNDVEGSKAYVLESRCGCTSLC